MKNNEFKIKTELKVKIFGAYCVTFNNFSAISLHIRLIKGGNHYISDSSREGNMDIYKELSGENSGFE